jgi:hypothetical protein
MQPAQIENRIDPAHQMIGRDHLIKAEIMEKTVLVTFQPPHHHAVLPKITGKTESHSQIPIKKEFCNSITLEAAVNCGTYIRQLLTRNRRQKPLER